MKRDRLATVLRLRRLDEQAAQVRLREALVALAETERALGQWAATLADEEAWLALVQAGPTTGSACQAASAAVAQARTRRDTAALAVGEAAGQMALTRDALAAATRRREVVERLRERQHALARRAEERAETVRLAEVATVQHVFGSREA